MEGGNIVICIKCFWSHGKILFLAEIIAGQRSALMCNCVALATGYFTLILNAVLLLYLKLFTCLEIITVLK